MRALIIILSLLVTTAHARGTLVAEWVEGDYRYCKYEVSPGEYRITTIQAVDICPLSY